MPKTAESSLGAPPIAPINTAELGAAGNLDMGALTTEVPAQSPLASIDANMKADNLHAAIDQVADLPKTFDPTKENWQSGSGLDMEQPTDPSTLEAAVAPAQLAVENNVSAPVDPSQSGQEFRPSTFPTLSPAEIAQGEVKDKTPLSASEAAQLTDVMSTNGNTEFEPDQLGEVISQDPEFQTSDQLEAAASNPPLETPGTGRPQEGVPAEETKHGTGSDAMAAVTSEPANPSPETPNPWLPSADMEADQKAEDERRAQEAQNLANMPVDNAPRTANDQEPPATADDLANTRVEATSASAPAVAGEVIPPNPDGTAASIDGNVEPQHGRAAPGAESNFGRLDNADRPAPENGGRAEVQDRAAREQAARDAEAAIPLEQRQAELSQKAKDGTASPAELRQLNEVNTKLNSEARKTELTQRLADGQPLTAEEMSELTKLNETGQNKAESKLSPEEQANKELDDMGLEIMRKMAKGEMPTKEEAQAYAEKQAEAYSLKSGFTEAQMLEAVRAARNPEFRSRVEKKLAIEKEVQELVIELAKLEMTIMGLPKQVAELKKAHSTAKKSIKQLPPPSLNESAQMKKDRADNRQKMMTTANLRSQIIIARNTESIVSADYGLVQAELRRKLGITGFWGGLIESTGAQVNALTSNLRVDIDSYLAGD